MPSNPQYVRLVDRLTGSLLADMETGSGWSIAGFDVKQWPDDPVAQRFVRSKLHEGLLEAASRAEYDEIREAEELAAQRNQRPSDQTHLGGEPSVWQENRIQEHAKQVRSKLVEVRMDDASSTDYDPFLGRSLRDEHARSPEEDEARREALVRQAEEEGLNTDDPEEQVARSTGQAPPRKARGARKTAARRSASAAPPEDEEDDDE